MYLTICILFFVVAFFTLYFKVKFVKLFWYEFLIVFIASVFFFGFLVLILNRYFPIDDAGEKSALLLFSIGMAIEVVSIMVSLAFCFMRAREQNLVHKSVEFDQRLFSQYLASRKITYTQMRYLLDSDLSSEDKKRVKIFYQSQKSS